MTKEELIKKLKEECNTGQYPLITKDKNNIYNSCFHFEEHEKGFEHIVKKCKNCGYFWYENTADKK